MKLPFSIALLALMMVPVRSEEADPVGAALGEAQKATKEAGVDLSKVDRKDVDRLVDKAKSELAKAQDKAKDKGQPVADKPADKPPGGIANADIVALNELPAWIPAVPGFQPDGGGAKGVTGGLEKGKTHGTAALKPKDLAEAWAAKVPAGFKVVRKTSEDEGKTVEIVRMTSKADPTRWVEIKAEPGGENAPTSVRLRYETPAAKGESTAKADKK